MTSSSSAVTRIAVFASGAGSNARKLLEYFNSNTPASQAKGIEVALVVSNKIDAGVLQIAAEYQVATLIIEKEKFFRGNAYVSELKQAGISFIVLAGFLWKVPAALVQAFSGKNCEYSPRIIAQIWWKRHVRQLCSRGCDCQ